MKERLVEDWLIRINERGYEVPFCQSLSAKGYKIIRYGHSPTEHGKDVIAVAPDETVCAYQLKTGDFGQAEITKYLEQLKMLVETRPVHPALSESFNYRPFLVTTGEFKEPAVSLIKELNASWRHRKLPELAPINGKQLHVDFMALSSNFWPVEAPEVRRFRELYLVDGRGDLDVSQYANFLLEILRDAKSALDLDRRVSAANLFASYLLGEFYRQQDHWSVFQGWVICAAQIAWAGETSNFPNSHWQVAFDLSKAAALDSLRALADEAVKENALRVFERELDELTRTRNTTALAAAACWQIIGVRESKSLSTFENVVALMRDLFHRNRVFFWGEGAFSQFLMFIWLLEHSQQTDVANSLLIDLIRTISRQNAQHSKSAFEDPYLSPDECLVRLFDRLRKSEPTRPLAIESYSLFPLIILAVRRNLRTELEPLWSQITRVQLTGFIPEKNADVLRWRCDAGKEYEDGFQQPQSWKVLSEAAFRDDRERLPRVLRSDAIFSLMFMLAFPHRIPWGLVKFLDDRIVNEVTPKQ